jgi:hypothetical protein
LPAWSACFSLTGSSSHDAELFSDLSSEIVFLLAKLANVWGKKLVYSRGGIKIFKALARLASKSKFLLAKSEKNSPKPCLF